MLSSHHCIATKNAFLFVASKRIAKKFTKIKQKKFVKKNFQKIFIYFSHFFFFLKIPTILTKICKKILTKIKKKKKKQVMNFTQRTVRDWNIR